MKQPVWIINISVLIIFIISILIIFIFKINLPRIIILNVPTNEFFSKVDKERNLDFNLIYRNDLFGNYVEAPKKEFIKKTFNYSVEAIPDIPEDIPVKIEYNETLEFVDPLKIKLKGVIYFKDNELDSIAIIEDIASKVEQNYRVGQLVEDGQILKILPSKVLLIRSNGQQESLYLNINDATNEFKKLEAINFDTEIVKIAENKYKINVDEFKEKINNIGTFLNYFDLKPVFKKGLNIGYRIGNENYLSLPYSLGFKFNDIIESVDNVLVSNVANKMEIYNNIMLKKINGDKILVKLLRDSQKIQNEYTLIFDNESSIINTPIFDSNKNDKKYTAADIYLDEQKKIDLFKAKNKIAENIRKIEEKKQKNISNLKENIVLSRFMNKKF